jgi:hypothetical protein
VVLECIADADGLEKIRHLPDRLRVPQEQARTGGKLLGQTGQKRRDVFRREVDEDVAAEHGVAAFHVVR